MILHPIIDRLKIISELLPTAIGGEFVPSGTKQISITENGTTTENVFSYADAEITVNVPPSGIIPTGTKQISITENGTTTEDVTNYANAEITVNVPPSGTSLPSIIDKIDGGSFTVSTDTSASDYSINHTLGVIPTGWIIWLEDELSGTSSTRYLLSVGLSACNVTDANNNNFIYNAWYGMLYIGNRNGQVNGITSSQASDYVTTTTFRYNNSNLYYKSGLTYKWIAWS